MKKLLIVTIIALFCSASAFAALSWTYGWEDGTGTALGTYGNAIVSNSIEQAYEGTHSLKMIEDPLGGTPQAFIWWVTGLSSGDVVVADFYVYDTTPSASPSGRIWGHYTDDTNDVTSSSGSASGDTTYSAGNGWTNLSYTWTFDSKGGVNNGLVVETRIYSATNDNANVLYIDTASITVSNDTVKIYNAAGQALPEPFMFSALILGLGALFLRKK